MSRASVLTKEPEKTKGDAVEGEVVVVGVSLKSSPDASVGNGERRVGRGIGARALRGPGARHAGGPGRPESFIGGPGPGPGSGSKPRARAGLGLEAAGPAQAELGSIRDRDLRMAFQPTRTLWIS